MATGDFRLNYKGMGKYLVSEEMLKMVRRRGKVVMATAEAIAPEYSGEYKTKFELETSIRDGKHPRACATVKNTSDHALAVEFGRAATPRHRTLGKALGVAE